MERNQQAVMVSKEAHRKLKVYCAKIGKSMGEVLEKFINDLKK